MQQARRLDGMFRQAYRGQSVRAFLEALPIYHAMYDPKKHFGRCIFILQSSGTGKSRMVKELGNEVHFISVIMLFAPDRSTCVDSNPQHLLP
jgi:DNA helicase TIP49 (TBP-interacting protein)